MTTAMKGLTQQRDISFWVKGDDMRGQTVKKKKNQNLL